MKTPEFFKRSELTATLWLFRREFLVVGIFSMVANVLMFGPRDEVLKALAEAVAKARQGAVVVPANA